MTEFGASGPGYSIVDPEVDAMSAAYAGPGAAFHVVTEGGVVVGGGGVAALEGGEAGCCEVRKMYFLPAARGRGAGRALLDQCLRDARRLGYTYCYLETLQRMTGAQRLYQRAGFTRLAGPMGHTGHHRCDAFYGMPLA
jgi:putative acetyltransferase